MTRPLFEGGRPAASVSRPDETVAPRTAVAPLRNFEAEQAQRAHAPRPLFEPAITAELPTPFVAAASQLASPPEDTAQLRLAYRLLQALQDASDEAIVQFGAEPARYIDQLLHQAVAMLSHPGLARTGALMRDILAQLPWQARGWLPWSKPRTAPQQLARWSQTLQAQLAELADLQARLLEDAGRMMRLIAQHAEPWADLHAHRVACQLAPQCLPALAPARQERLARRAQLLDTLCTAAALTHQQLHQLREHFLDVAERVQTLRMSTLPLWRQHALALHQQHQGAGTSDADHRLLDQLNQLAELVSHHAPLPTQIRPGA